MLIASCNVFILPYIHSIWAARIARFLMGAGCAGAFLACMQVIRLYFPTHLRAILTGVTVTIGALAGFVCNAGLIWIIKLADWQLFIWVIAAIGLGLMLLVWLFFPKYSVSTKKQSLVSGLLQVLSNPLAWFIGIICALMYLPYAMFNDLWGQSFFRVTDHLNVIQAGIVISAIWLGWVIGAIFWGWLSFQLKSLLKPIVSSIFLQILALLSLLFLHKLSFYMDIVMAFSLGFSASAMNLCYVFGQRINPKQSASSSTAMINSLVTLGVIIYLPFTGWLLSTLSASVKHIINISPEIYVAVFSSFVFILLFCLMLTFILKRLTPATVG